MTEKETAQILAIVRTAYPNVKIENPAGMVKVWHMILGEYSSEEIFNAAKLHISISKYFPTPADISEKIVRAEIVYGKRFIEMQKIESTSVKQISAPDDLDDFIESFYNND